MVLVGSGFACLVRVSGLAWWGLVGVGFVGSPGYCGFVRGWYNIRFRGLLGAFRGLTGLGLDC